MKKILLTIFLFLFVLSNIFSQIKITKNDMPSSGDTIRYSNALATSMKADLTKTGANQTWDFSQLKPINQGVYEFKPSYKTPYVFSFFGAFGQKLNDSIGIGLAKMENIWAFYSKTSSKYSTRGYGFSLKIPGFPVAIPQKGEYSDYDEVYKFPLEYNDVDNSTFKLKVAIKAPLAPALGEYFQNGTRKNHVDGWGKITTPYGKDIQCIRVKTTIVRKDSISIKTPKLNNSLPSQTIIEYKWLSNSEKIPVLEIKGNEVAGKFVPTQIIYRDNYRKITSRLDPKSSFTIDKTQGEVDKDIFTLESNSKGFPNKYEWTIVPDGHHTYMNGTKNTDKKINLQFDKKGKYTVKLKVNNLVGEDDTTAVDLITIDEAINIPNINYRPLTVFPNPAINFIHVVLKNPSAYKILKVDGKVVLQGITTGNIHLTTLASGHYYLLINNDKTNFVGKFVKP